MVTLAVNEALYEQGYDSDSQLGPLYDNVRGEEGECFFEDTIDCVLMENNMPNGGTPTIPTDTDKNDEFSHQITSEESSPG